MGNITCSNPAGGPRTAAMGRGFDAQAPNRYAANKAPSAILSRDADPPSMTGRRRPGRSWSSAARREWSTIHVGLRSHEVVACSPALGMVILRSFARGWYRPLLQPSPSQRRVASRSSALPSVRGLLVALAIAALALPLVGTGQGRAAPTTVVSLTFD